MHGAAEYACPRLAADRRRLFEPERLVAVERRRPCCRDGPRRFALAIVFLLGTGPCTVGQVELPGLTRPVRVVTDHEGVWHITAHNDSDLATAQGYVHCRDRFFQMDDTRRQVDGTEAELLGPDRLPSDIQARVIGLHRAAQRFARRRAARFARWSRLHGRRESHCLTTLPHRRIRAARADRRAAWEPSTRSSRQGDRGLALARHRHRPHAAAVRLHQAGLSRAASTVRRCSPQDVFRSAPIDSASTVPDATNTSPTRRWKAQKVRHLARGPRARRTAVQPEARGAPRCSRSRSIGARASWASNEWADGPRSRRPAGPDDRERPAHCR